MTPESESRFWSKVDKSGECWVWMASRLPWGYGQFGVAGRTSARAHRVSWEMAYGPIPDGLLVLHRCDNPPCVRPDHLFLGTARDNLLDAIAKGRHAAPVALSGDEHWSHRRPELRVRGAKNGASKVTAEDVPVIRAARESGVKLGVLAERYGISKTAVSLIARRINWEHVA